MKYLLVCLVLVSNSLNAQMIFPESFVLIMDTTQFLRGHIAPAMDMQRQKEVLLEIENSADIAFRIKNYVLSFANNIEFDKSGSDILLNGGYVYAELRRTIKQNVMPEYYAQYQLDQARGLLTKYAGGINLRIKLHRDSLSAIFIGFGPFYEYEKWNFDGVASENLPLVTSEIDREYIKLNTYLSMKWRLLKNFNLDFSFYFQDVFEDIFNNPRLGGNINLNYQITRHFAMGIDYFIIYDPDPVVPIDNIWYRLQSGMEFSF